MKTSIELINDKFISLTLREQCVVIFRCKTLFSGNRGFTSMGVRVCVAQIFVHFLYPYVNLSVHILTCGKVLAKTLSDTNNAI